MQRILLSALVVGGVVGAAVYGTTAFFSDTETSVNNTFTAGALDLTIDSTAHYNGMVCTVDSGWQPENENNVPDYPVQGSDCTGTWAAQDLVGNPLFDYADIKPGDFGENTLSVHVASNDAWFRLKLTGKENADNLVNDPESESLAENGQDGLWCGELAQSMQYSMWNDEGDQAGWQGSILDSKEGNNIKDGLVEFYIVEDQLIMQPGDAQALCDSPEDEELVYTSPHAPLMANTTHYLGLSWKVPETVGNEIQTDSIKFDVSFEVEQQRNNPNPFQAI